MEVRSQPCMPVEPTASRITRTSRRWCRPGRGQKGEPYRTRGIQLPVLADDLGCCETRQRVAVARMPPASSRSGVGNAARDRGKRVFRGAVQEGQSADGDDDNESEDQRIFGQALTVVRLR
jgi:hypothetical protein